jgi:hypothetical protein
MFLSNCVLKTIPWVIGCTIYNVISTTVKNAIVVFAEESSTLPGWRSAKWRGKSMSFPITYDFWCNNVLLLPATNGFYFIGSELVVSTWKRFLLVIPSPYLKNTSSSPDVDFIHYISTLMSGCSILTGIDRGGMNSPFQGSAAPHIGLAASQVAGG